jgi:protein-tyrosine phosphatase
MSHSTKILMVCLGNICRSPVAAGILRDKVKQTGLNIIVHSAGTSNYHIGESADERSKRNALKNQVDISDHRARQFVADDFERYDIIYAMDEENLRNIQKLAPGDHLLPKAKMILDELHPGKKLPVPDPYFGGEEGFQQVFDLLNEVCDKIIEKHQP